MIKATKMISRRGAFSLLGLAAALGGWSRLPRRWSQRLRPRLPGRSGARPGARVARRDVKAGALVARRDARGGAPLASCGARRGSAFLCSVERTKGTGHGRSRRELAQAR